LLTQTSGLADVAGVSTAPLATRVKRSSQNPLTWHPGERWSYSSAGMDTLLRIIEIVSGENPNALLLTRVFGPLGMKHTSFQTCGVGECLFSSVSDLVRFGQMLLDHGELDNVRLLGPRTVDLMHSPFVKDMQTPEGHGRAFGLGVEIVSDPITAHAAVSAGTFGWTASMGPAVTGLSIDPAERIVLAVCGRGLAPLLISDIQGAVMQAIVN